MGRHAENESLKISAPFLAADRRFRSRLLMDSAISGKRLDDAEQFPAISFSASAVTKNVGWCREILVIVSRWFQFFHTFSYSLVSSFFTRWFPDFSLAAFKIFHNFAIQLFSKPILKKSKGEVAGIF